MSRSRCVAAIGILAGVAANYWALETLLADRTDPAGSLDQRPRRPDRERPGWLFDLLEAASGLLAARVRAAR